jgi:hypothetical protein
MPFQFPQIIRKRLKRKDMAGLAHQDAGKKGIKTHIGTDVINHISDL